MKFYTNVQSWGNSILYRGVENGQPVQRQVKTFQPTLYVNSNKPSQWKTIYDKYVEPILPGSIKDCKEFIETYKDVAGFEIHGNTYWQYQYISEEHPGDVDYDFNAIKIANLDIETQSENGFASTDHPTEQINVITVKCQGTRYVFAVGEFSLNMENTIAVSYDTEEQMLKDFIATWQKISPDVITGWNVRFFDIPYLINRITMLFGDKEAEKLSPWNILRDEKVEIRGKESNTYKIMGISILDYYELYRKYTYGAEESYALNHIASVELGKKKLDYSEFENIKEFYTKNFQKFVEYNVQDVDLVQELDEKLNLLDLHISVAYAAKINYDDAYSQVRTWDTLIYNYLLEHNKVIPQKEITSKDVQYEGAYVKDPQIGFHNWVVSFDVASMYPNIIRMINISPDTILQYMASFDMTKFMDDSVDLSQYKQYCIGVNGSLYDKNKNGFMPELVDKFYSMRKKKKKEMIQCKLELEEIRKELHRRKSQNL